MTEAGTEEAVQQRRRGRVRLLKRLIVVSLILMILTPTVLCVILFVRINRMSARLEEMTERISQEELRQDKTEKEVQDAARAEREKTEAAAREEMEGSSGTQESREQTDGGREVYLTFDDGPSDSTEDILDILDEYGVKATFFVVGKEEAKYRPLYQRIVADGHTLAMHSYSHKYNEIYQSVESFSGDLTKLQDFLYGITGTRPVYCRFPGGSSNTVSKVDMQDLMAYLDGQGITYFDWNISSGDADSGKVGIPEIVDNCISGIQAYRHCMILMHDASDKRTTVEALPIVIEKILDMEDTRIVPVTEETEPIQHIKYQGQSANGGV